MGVGDRTVHGGRPPSMTDVAALANVSHQTVSRVLNAHPSVRPETRERVVDAIARLGYRRNSAARALVTRRTGTIGVLTTGSALYGPISTLVALEEAAREAGYFVSVATIRRFDHETMDGVLEHFMSQRVEGMVVIAPQDAVAEAVDAFRAPLPVVLIAARPDDGTDASAAGAAGQGTVSVSVDQRLGAREATEHLLGLGHRSVTHLSGPGDWFDAREREVGWAQALRAAGLQVPEAVRCDWSAECGYEAGLVLAGQVHRGDGPTAVFAGNDQLALGLLHACAEVGVRVPDELSVVGFDDVQGAAHFHPPLTTVRQPFDELGRRSLAAMLHALAVGPDTAGRDLIRPVLVVRGSTTAPPARPAG